MDVNLKSLTLALVAGIASFLLVGFTVAAVTERWIEFSVFLGIPAGLIAAVVAAAAVALGFDSQRPEAHRRIALGVGLFGIGFLVTLVVLVAASQGLVLSMTVGVVIGVLAAFIGYIRGQNAQPSTMI